MGAIFCRGHRGQLCCHCPLLCCLFIPWQGRPQDSQFAGLVGGCVGEVKHKGYNAWHIILLRSNESNCCCLQIGNFREFQEFWKAWWYYVIFEKAEQCCKESERSADVFEHHTMDLMYLSFLYQLASMNINYNCINSICTYLQNWSLIFQCF